MLQIKNEDTCKKLCLKLDYFILVMQKFQKQYILLIFCRLSNGDSNIKYLPLNIEIQNTIFKLIQSQNIFYN